MTTLRHVLNSDVDIYQNLQDNSQADEKQQA